MGCVNRYVYARADEFHLVEPQANQWKMFATPKDFVAQHIGGNTKNSLFLRLIFPLDPTRFVNLLYTLKPLRIFKSLYLRDYSELVGQPVHRYGRVQVSRAPANVY